MRATLAAEVQMEIQITQPFTFYLPQAGAHGHVLKQERVDEVVLRGLVTKFKRLPAQSHAVVAADLPALAEPDTPCVGAAKCSAGNREGRDAGPRLVASQLHFLEGTVQSRVPSLRGRVFNFEFYDVVFAPHSRLPR